MARRAAKQSAANVYRTPQFARWQASPFVRCTTTTDSACSGRSDRSACAGLHHRSNAREFVKRLARTTLVGMLASVARPFDRARSFDPVRIVA